MFYFANPLLRTLLQVYLKFNEIMFRLAKVIFYEIYTRGLKYKNFILYKYIYIFFII